MVQRTLRNEYRAIFHRARADISRPDNGEMVQNFNLDNPGKKSQEGYEQSYTELRVDEIYAGSDPIGVKQQQKTQSNRVKTIVNNYAEYPNVFQFLKCCAHNIEFHV